MMNDLTKLKEILDNQIEMTIESGDWERLGYEEREHDEIIRLVIGNVQITFCFTPEGKLIGAYNWKD